MATKSPLQALATFLVIGVKLVSLHSLGTRPLSLHACSSQKWSGDGEVSLKMQSLEQTALLFLIFALF